MRWRRLKVPGCALLVLLMMWPSVSRAASRGILEANLLAAVPVSGTLADGWSGGWGVGGALRVRLGQRLEAGAEVDFVQFKFAGLSGFATLGGERRFVRTAVPLRLTLWERPSPGRERLSAQVSLGWAWQRIDGTFGGADDRVQSPKLEEDGLAWTAGLRFSRILYRTTRWSAELRYTGVNLEVENAQYVSLVLGAQMPLDGSRPH